MCMGGGVWVCVCVGGGGVVVVMVVVVVVVGVWGLFACPSSAGPRSRRR